jgi:hypothetical protein
MLTRERRKVGCEYQGVGAGVRGVDVGRSPVPTVRGRVEVRRMQRGKIVGRRNWVAGRCSLIASVSSVNFQVQSWNLGRRKVRRSILVSKTADRPPR